MNFAQQPKLTWLYVVSRTAIGVLLVFAAFAKFFFLEPFYVTNSLVVPRYLMLGWLLVEAIAGAACLSFLKLKMLYPFLLSLFCCFFTISWYKIWNGAVVCDCLGGETPLTIMAIADTSLLVILLLTRKQYRVEIDFANAHSKFSEIRAAGFVLLTMVLLPLVAKISIQEVSGVLTGGRVSVRQPKRNA